MAKFRMAVLLSVVLVFLFGCSMRIGGAQATTVTGVLARAAAIGGETSGWEIRLAAPTEIAGSSVESVEVTFPEGQLGGMEGKHVAATGRIVIQNGVERGERRVLEISSIGAIPSP